MIHRHQNKICDELSEIEMDIYLIGYTKHGESCIFIITSKKSKRKVLYSAIIDCYEENVNQTKEILKKFCIEKLDMLVWTHPHDDHTKGISELIDEFCSKKTEIILADILYKSVMEGLSDDCRKVAEKMSVMNKGLKEGYKINSMAHLGSVLEDMEFENSVILKRMQITCIAPVPCINAKQQAKRCQNLKDICIAVIIEVLLVNGKKMNFMFSGDIENEVLTKIKSCQEDYEIPDTYNFIKIPHHGGRSAEKLKELLNPFQKSEYAAVTTYIKDSEQITNPDIKLLEEYKEYVENIGCTSDLYNKKYGMGIINVHYSLNAVQMVSSIKMQDNAVRNAV